MDQFIGKAMDMMNQGGGGGNNQGRQNQGDYNQDDNGGQGYGGHGGRQGHMRPDNDGDIRNDRADYSQGLCSTFAYVLIP